MAMKLLVRLNMFIIIYELDNSSHLIEMHEFRSYSLEKVSDFKSLSLFPSLTCGLEFQILNVFSLSQTLVCCSRESLPLWSSGKDSPSPPRAVSSCCKSVHTLILRGFFQLSDLVIKM